jgi:RNA polymerase sigma-70 factor (ECF subfamily)
MPPVEKIGACPSFWPDPASLRSESKCGATDLIFREVEDRDLISKARKGDVEAYNLLVSRWEKRVFNYLLRLTGGRREDAQDLSQDVFLKAYQNLAKLDDPAKFAGWLFRIAHNEAYSLLRKNRLDDAEITFDPVTAEASLGSGGRMFPVELSLAVQRALERLNSDQREAVLLKVYQGFKFEEMAEILEIPVSTVKSRLYTALDLLKTALTPLSAR